MDFETYLKLLPNNSGIGLYVIETAIGKFYFCPIKKKFSRLKDLGGYKEYSLTSEIELTAQESEDLEDILTKYEFVFCEYNKISEKRILLYNGFSKTAKVLYKEHKSTRKDTIL